jgi:hypothetical protein
MPLPRSRTRTRSRTLAAVGFLFATGLFLTACDPDADEAAGSAAGSGATSDTETGAATSADGTFTGKLTYLAPGKLMVGDRAFWIAESTDVRYGEICGDPETTEAEKCTVEETEATAKDGSLNVKVTIEQGTAVKITGPH